MSRRISKKKRKTFAQRLADLERQHRQLLAELARLGFIYQGSVAHQRLTCGQPQCACHRDRKRRHGPYAYWTTKVKGRTVSRRLSEAEASIIEQWVQNRRKFDEIRRKLLAISKKTAPLMLEKEKEEE
jgi:hypothetical protein